MKPVAHDTQGDVVFSTHVDTLASTQQVRRPASSAGTCRAVPFIHRAVAL